MPDQHAVPLKPAATRPRSVSGPLTAFSLLATFVTVLAARFGLTSGTFLVILTAISGAAIIAAGMSRP